MKQTLYNNPSICSNCRVKKTLQQNCSCKTVSYCSRYCQIADASKHFLTCPTKYSQQNQQQQNYQQQNKQSKLKPFISGLKNKLVGLKNINNTCFMNSSLQCLSHIIQLTNYFITNLYLSDINKSNPLGSKGDLSTVYAQLLKKLWQDTQQNPSGIQPTAFRQILTKIQPTYTSGNQQDPLQFIQFFINTLNQDLKKNLPLPNQPIINYQAQSQCQIASKYWQYFYIKNQSIISDLIYGQYRSVLTCSSCNKSSTLFCPFSIFSLPLPKYKLTQQLSIIYLQHHLRKTLFIIPYGNKQKISDLANVLSNKINKPSSKLVFFTSSYKQCQYHPPETFIYDLWNHPGKRLHLFRLVQNQQSPNSQNIQIIISHTYKPDNMYSTKDQITPYRLHFYKPATTFTQLYNTLSQYYNQLNPKHLPFKLLATKPKKPNKCIYCNKQCQGCQIPHNNTQLKYLIKNNCNTVYLQLYWYQQGDKIKQQCLKLESITPQPTNKLNDEQTTLISLKNCFQLFQKPQILTDNNKWFCSICNNLVTAQKSIKIYKSPKIFIISLNRFKKNQYQQKKFQMFVNFPINNFDISQFVINKNLPTDTKNCQNNSQNGRLLYDLFAIITHTGNMNSGHCIAKCKNPISQGWYSFDDNIIHKIYDSDIVSEDAYILFYRRKS